MTPMSDSSYSGAATVDELGVVERTALLDFARSNQRPEPAMLESLVRLGLVRLIPALTTRGCEVAEEGGWKWD
jgi:hypothetical protein